MEYSVIRVERRRVIRREQHEYYVAPTEGPMIMVEKLGKRSDHQQQDFADHFHKPYNYYPQQNLHTGHKGPYMYETVDHQQSCVANKGGPLVQTRIDPRVPHQKGTVTQYHHEGEDYQQPNMASSVMDAEEVAKLYGGVVFTKYGRKNKFPVRAN